MKTIGIVDDKDIQRRSFALKVDLKLEELFPEWNTCSINPFKNIEDYREWILEEEISVLIVDERLDEGKLSDGTNANYFGSDLVKVLRKYFKDIPIYCITTYEITKSLKSSLSYFNLILSRSKFDQDIDNYLNSFIRSGVSFYETYQKELARLGYLSERIALGTATDMEIKEALSLQTRLVIPHSTKQIKDREKYLQELEDHLLAIKEINKEIQQIIKKQ